MNYTVLHMDMPKFVYLILSKFYGYLWVIFFRFLLIWKVEMFFFHHFHSWKRSQDNFSHHNISIEKKTNYVLIHWLNFAIQNHNRNGNAIMTRKYYHFLIETFIVCKVMHMAYSSKYIVYLYTTQRPHKNYSKINQFICQWFNFIHVQSETSIFFSIFMWYLSIEWMNLVGINSKTFFYLCTICWCTFK